MYADDLKILQVKRSVVDYSGLQRDFDAICDW